MSIDWGGRRNERQGQRSGRLLGLWVTHLEANRPDPLSCKSRPKAQELTSPELPDFLSTKLRDITEYIQKNVRYFIVVRGIGGWQAHYAADIYHAITTETAKTRPHC